MPRLNWALRDGRLCVEVLLTPVQGGQPFPRTLLADTGAGEQTAPFQLILHEDDCLLCGGFAYLSVMLTGAYAGAFPLYNLRVRLPALGFDQHLRAVGVPSLPPGFDGIACFSFLDRFTYSNFGDPSQFGLEC